MYSARDDGGSSGSMWRLPLALGVLWGIWSTRAETSEEHFVAGGGDSDGGQAAEVPTAVQQAVVRRSAPHSRGDRRKGGQAALTSGHGRGKGVRAGHARRT